MLDELAQKAIDEALGGNWETARRLNEQILKADPQNQEALNRLARALLELGKPDRAIALYKKVLRLDPYNSIAQKALERLTKVGKSPKRKDGLPLRPSTVRIAELFIANRENLGRKSEDEATRSTDRKREARFGMKPEDAPAVKPESFIEEPGKTKTVALIHLGDDSVISALDTGEPVKLLTHAHRVSVQTGGGSYIGRLPDDLARRIIKLTRAGNEYISFICSVSLDSVRIFAREVKRGEGAPDIPSFPPTEKIGYVSFTPPGLVHEERPETSSEDEQE